MQLLCICVLNFQVIWLCSFSCERIICLEVEITALVNLVRLDVLSLGRRSYCFNA